MDKIKVNNMQFYGYHGVFAEENKLGQRFRVNATLELDLSVAGGSDQVDDSINYAHVYNACRDIIEGESVNLVETLAERIASDLLGRFSLLKQVTVEVIKPDPPINGHYDSVAIEITRSRAE